MRSYWKIKLWAKFVNHFDVLTIYGVEKSQCDHSIGPIFTFVSILGHIISFLHSRTIKMGYPVCFRVPKIRFCVCSK